MTKTQHLFAVCTSVFLVALFCVPTFQSQAENKKPPTTRPQQHKHRHAHPSMPSTKPKFAERSIYQVQHTWFNQDGASVKLASFRKKVCVITMVYTSCPSACPIIVSDLKNIERQLPKKLLPHIQFVLVSFDTVRDTTKRLRSFFENKQMVRGRWHLLRGEEMPVLELALLLGIKYKRISKLDFSHSNVISVLDQQGVIKFQQKGLANAPKHTVAMIKKLLNHK